MLKKVSGMVKVAQRFGLCSLRGYDGLFERLRDFRGNRASGVAFTNRPVYAVEHVLHQIKSFSMS